MIVIVCRAEEAEVNAAAVRSQAAPKILEIVPGLLSMRWETGRTMRATLQAEKLIGPCYGRVFADSIWDADIWFAHDGKELWDVVLGHDSDRARMETDLAPGLMAAIAAMPAHEPLIARGTDS